MVRASSGYSMRKIANWISDHKGKTLKKNNLLSFRYSPNPLLDFFDKIFLRVIKDYPNKSPDLFFNLFNQSNHKSLIKFLSDKPSWLDIINIIMSMPKRSNAQGSFEEEMNKILKHQIFVIMSGLVILSLYFFLLPTTHLNLDFTLLSKANPILLISFLLISTLAISHGAFDGKIIWESGSKKNAFILYLIYISISLLGSNVMASLPYLGLFILLAISTIHFGHSDLAYIGNKQKYLKYSWGLAMTFMPVLFHHVKRF